MKSLRSNHFLDELFKGVGEELITTMQKHFLKAKHLFGYDWKTKRRNWEENEEM